MALINCPECNKQVSDRANICIHCGFPLEDFLQKVKEEKIYNEKYICKSCGFDNEIGSDYCNNCGMRLTDYLLADKPVGFSYAVDFSKKPHTICPKCGKKNKAGLFKCGTCGYDYKLDDYSVIVPKIEDEEFNGIYKYVFGEKVPVYCPRCGSSNCSHFQENRTELGKARYSYNLNPFRIFTFANKKQTIKNHTVSKICCNDCGKIFQ